MSLKAKKKGDEVWLPFKEAALRFGISVTHLNREVREGCPMEFRRSGKRGSPMKVIPMKAAAEWMAAKGVKLGGRAMLKPGPTVEEQPETPAPAIPTTQPVEPPPGPAPRQATAADMGYLASIERMKRAELSSFNDYANAKRSGNLALSLAAFRNWENSQKRLEAAEMNVLTLDHFRKLAREEAREDIQRWGEPVRMFLDGMPRALANRVNPTSPAHAEKILREWLNTQLYPLMHNPFKAHEKENPRSGQENQDPQDRVQEARRPEAAPAQPAPASGEGNAGVGNPSGIA